LLAVFGFRQVGGRGLGHLVGTCAGGSHRSRDNGRTADHHGGHFLEDCGAKLRRFFFHLASENPSLETHPNSCRTVDMTRSIRRARARPALIQINRSRARACSLEYKVRRRRYVRLVKFARFRDLIASTETLGMPGKSKTRLRKYKARREHGTIFIVAICAVLLTGCMHAAPPMLTERTAMISGRATSGRSAADATQIVLVKAAAMTLDHGFRYFRIADGVVADSSSNELIRPGANVTITLYRAGEISPRATGIVDAEDIAQHMQTRLASLPAPGSSSAPSTTTPVPAHSGTPAPHCTVYGCVW
jgi:hypothetical protein